MDIATRDPEEPVTAPSPEASAKAPHASGEGETAVADAQEAPESAPGPEEQDGSASSAEEPAAEAPSEDQAPAPKPKKMRRGPGQKKSDKELVQELFTLLFASPEALSRARLVELLERPDPKRVDEALEGLAKRLKKTGLAVVLRELAGGWRLLTDPAAGEVLQRLKKEPKPERISSAALETLSIVAYRQPVTKGEIEAIRGVQSGALLRTLVDRGLVKVSGRAEMPGSPLQYATTKDFLDRFGLASLKDLPRDGELTSD